MKDFVIIPTYNEAGNIAVTLDKILSLYPEINVLVIDDNSPDGTADVVRGYSAGRSNIELYSRPRKLGLASAYIGGMRKILNEYPATRAIITFDADLAHDPAVIGTMLRLIEHYDLITGSRYVPGGSIAHWQLWRRMLSRLGNLYARTVTGTPIMDMTSGFHCFRAELLRQYDFERIFSTGFAFLMEIKIIAHRLGARIREVPIRLGDRKDGKSKMSNHIIYEGVILPWKLRFDRNLLAYSSKRTSRPY